MNQIIVLDIKFKFSEVEEVIHPVVLKDNQNMILIDCGYTGFLPAIKQAMAENSLNCSELTHVLITHQDHDHMGAAFTLKQEYPQVQIIASKEEAPYISGKLKSLRLEQAEALQMYLPEEHKQFGLQFINVLQQVQPVSVDLVVDDGDTFDWCGGCTILGTPGHTPGHISIYLNESNIMITGDAAALENNNLVIANPQYTLDIKKAEASLQKIMSYNAEEIICYHGGIHYCLTL